MLETDAALLVRIQTILVFPKVCACEKFPVMLLVPGVPPLMVWICCTGAVAVGAAKVAETLLVALIVTAQVVAMLQPLIPPHEVNVQFAPTQVPLPVVDGASVKTTCVPCG